FVPWDDDCDVALYRSEYEKLIEALKTDTLSDGFYYYDIKKRKNDHFHDFADRIFYTKEVYREDDIYRDTYDGLYKYLWLDIFVLDDVVESYKKTNYLKLKMCYGLAMGHRVHIDYSDYKSIIQKIEVFVLSTIGKLYKMDDIIKIYHDIVSDNIKHKKDSEDIKNVYYANYPIKWIEYELPKKNEEYIYTEFEDTLLPINKNYDETLSILYGDYMTLPDEKDRHPEHIDIF
ncbi:MAG: LicD family protein, partial [Lachnospiraceae bacterium]|nr:LicD family protein [Lachnospiraceae bacterium]